MSKTPATVALTRAGIPHTVHPYRHDRDAVRDGLSYGQEAAEALGVQPARVLKTLVAAVDGELVVAVLPVSARLDLKALAAAARGKRAEMADAAAAQRATGYVVGGISPVGQRKRLRTIVDASALEHDTVYVSGGRRGLDIELSPRDLVAATGAIVAPCTTA